MPSDKMFWHDYLDAYEEFVFRDLKPKLILEYGVAQGESMIMLRKRFPEAQIIGVDIGLDPDLPKLEKVSYVQLDQRNQYNVRTLLGNYSEFDLIIDDGSHIPADQAVCLLASLSFIRSGGYYIVEDIHTNDANEANTLRVLLAIQHMKRVGLVNSATREDFSKLASSHFFDVDQIIYLCNSIADLKMVRRSSLPLHCWNCKSSKYDYVNLTCECRQPLFSHWDSMSFMIRKA